MEDADQMLERLAELVDEIPAMQAKNNRLARDTAARKVMDLAYDVSCREAELQQGERMFEEAQEALDEVRDKPDSSDLVIAETQTRLVHAGLARGMKVGPLNNARAELESALQAGGFATVDEAREALVSESDRAAVEREIADFKAEYSRVLEICQSFEKDQ